MIKVTATDLDEPGSFNALIRYTIESQDPPLPSGSMFVINAITGVIRINADGLDREVRLKEVKTYFICPVFYS